MSPSCLKSFNGSPSFTEQSLGPLTSIQSPWASGPALSHHFLPLPWRPSSPKELLVPGTRQSDFAFSAFFFMHLPVFRPWHLFSWDGISSGESSRSSGLLHCHSPPSWTWSRAHYVGILHCMSTVLPGRASRACLLVLSQPVSSCPARCLVCGRGPGIGSWTELLAFAPSRLLSH